MMKLRINPIVADNEEMAVKTIQEIYARIENIQQFPYMGSDLAKRVSFWTDYKYVICGNYVVLYKINDATEVTEKLNHGSLDFAVLPEPVDTMK